MIAEITVAKRSKLMDIQGLKDGCHTRMGGSCKETDRFSLCKLCMIDSDVARLRAEFERRFETTLESSKYLQKVSRVRELTKTTF